MAKKATKAAKPKQEQLAFKMHPSLLYDIVCRQAGTLSKAILEGVMNSGDAGATYCKITLDEKRVVIEDDGKGFANRRQIEEWFAVFGQPHSEEEGKTWGEFRMGRGQMFAYGKNVWSTGDFEITVDFKNCPKDNAGFSLGKSRARVPGCQITIDLYEELLPSDIAEVERTLEKWVRYAPLTVSLNNKDLSRDVTAEKWDVVTDEAYIRLDTTTSLSIYNLGIHTMDLGTYAYGTGGTIVSRKKLQVNFARNDVQSSCPAWKKIKPLVDQHATTRNTRSKALDDGSRQRLADQFLRGELMWNDVRDAKIITLVSGRNVALQTLMRYGVDVVTNATKGSRLGDALHESKIAIVLADCTLRRFDARSTDEFLQRVGEAMAADPIASMRWDLRRWKELVAEEFATLTADMNEASTIVPKAEYTPNEQLWIKLISACQNPIHREKPKRRIVLGESETMLAWTDGSTYIALSRKALRGLQFDDMSFFVVGRLLLHEYCHDDSDAGTHVHSDEFYRSFHDSADRIGYFASTCLSRLPHYAEVVGRKLTKATLRTQDANARGKQARKKFAAASS